MNIIHNICLYSCIINTKGIRKMSDVIFEARNLTKKYKNQYALDDVSITLKKDRIYGFIGENGAGKSTLMKIMAGLIFPTSGDMTFMGETDPAAIEKKRKSVGTMIEGPYIYPGYSVRQNVELQRLLVGNPDESATDRMIELVGLSDSRKKKAKKLSMGMKQRLGIAMAMVGNPRFLILDEPINGLDPKNIVTLRSMLKKINQEGDALDGHVGAVHVVLLIHCWGTVEVAVLCGNLAVIEQAVKPLLWCYESAFAMRDGDGVDTAQLGFA